VSESRAAATRAPFTAITLDGTSNVSSPLMDPKSRGKGSSSKSNSNSSKENMITVPSKTSKYISKTTRRTPQQVLKANMEINEMKEVRSRAYGWALDALNEPSNQHSAEDIAREATSRFGITVLANTLRAQKRKGQSGYIGQGRKPQMSDEHLDAISNGVMGWLTITQLNGEPEKKNIDMINILKDVLNNSNESKACPKWLWEKLKVKNAGHLNLSKEQMIELRRQTWTTYRNLKDWFDAFGNFCVQYGFATEVT
jgi:hypothetical protein